MRTNVRCVRWHFGWRWAVAALGLLASIFLAPAVSFAGDEALLGEEALGGSVRLTEDELGEVRGRAVLPDGLTVEVSVLMRFLVDGQELERSMVESAGAALPIETPGLPFMDSPPPIENALNGVALEHFQEINFTISNLPISIRPQQFMPRAFVPGGLIP